jgi:hypothetical protein
MPTNNLRLTLIATGSQAGSWGNTTNTNLGTLLDAGIAGYDTVSITTTTGQALTAATGAPDQARMAMLKLISDPGAAFILYAPPVSKQYIIWNSTGRTATVGNSTAANGIISAGGTTVTIANGEKAQIFSDGTNFYSVDPKVPSSVANGVVYANSSNVITNGTALTYDGTTFQNLGTDVVVRSTGSSGYGAFYATGATGNASYYFFGINGTETARITSTAANYMAFATGSAGLVKMRIESGGDIVVGDAAPTAAGGARGINIYNTEGTNVNSVAVVRLITDSVAGGSNFGADIYKTKGGALVLNNNETNPVAYITFGIGASERMRLDSSGVLTLNSVPVVTTAGTTTQSNGDNSTKLATTAYVQNMGLGWDQTWQNVIGIRALGSDYTNTTGKPIMVSVSISGAPNNGAFYMTIGGVIIGEQGVLSVSSAAMRATITAIVPPGAVYRADNSGGASLAYWAELR